MTHDSQNDRRPLRPWSVKLTPDELALANKVGKVRYWRRMTGESMDPDPIFEGYAADGFVPPDVKICTAVRRDAPLIVRPRDAGRRCVLVTVLSSEDYRLGGWVRADDVMIPEYWSSPDGRAYAYVVPRDRLICMCQMDPEGVRWRAICPNCRPQTAPQAGF